MITSLQLSVALALFASSASCVPVNTSCDATKDACIDGDFVTFPIAGGIVNITTSSLGINVRTSNSSLRLSNGIDSSDGLSTAPTLIDPGKGVVAWNITSRRCAVKAYSDKRRLIVALSQPDKSTVTWPITGSGVDSKYRSLQYPRGPGRNVPLDDKFWNGGTSEGAEGPGTDGDMAIAGDGDEIEMATNFLMPFWGYSAGQGLGSAYFLPEDIGTTVKHTSVGGSLQMSLTHTFSQRENTTSYTVVFELTNGSPLASAWTYRRYLQETGNLRLMKDKIAALPDNSRLLGAFHSYNFGDSGRSVQAMKNLASVGIKKLCLGYDDDPMSKEAVEQAQTQGYLIGPYDTYANGQPSNNSDTTLGKWPGTAYPDQCIHRFDNTIKPGFARRGCYMSTQAQALSEPTSGNLAARLKNTTENGAKAYFLDVDAASEFFTDFSPEHPQNMMTDRKNRLDRMLKISKQFVLGSEDSHGWANSAVSYGHGSFSQMDGRFFSALLNVSRIWGGYQPASGPDTFFKPIILPENFVTTMFDPRYMVPLSEAVLHDSVVNVDRWDLPLYKFPVLIKQRVLQSMLYNVPVLLAINGTVIEEKGKDIAKYQNFFQPLHEVGGLLPLTKFTYLTQDKMVQSTEFGNGELILTANFGDARDPASGLEGKCVNAKLRGKETSLCV
ncbi:hypothetical protein TWF696_008465 [Orbilia brochopaga]|uniref:Uncharacterized protein n=1 Tax=Orbilia brochopaga TaxID=3140254 RepID=A0AAV9ULJ6_9PEZI